MVYILMSSQLNHIAQRISISVEHPWKHKNLGDNPWPEIRTKFELLKSTLKLVQWIEHLWGK